LSIEALDGLLTPSRFNASTEKNKHEQEFGASFNGSPYKAVMSSYAYKKTEVYLERNVSFLECLGGLQ